MARGRGRGRLLGRGRCRGRGPVVSATSAEEAAGGTAEEVASAAHPAAEAQAAPAVDAQAASAIIIQNLQRENELLRQQMQAAHPAAVPTAAVVSVAGPVVAAVPPETRISLREWMSLRLDTFDGAGTPVQVADWLRYMERQFDALEMNSVQRVRFVAFQLKGQADIWWEGVLSARTPVQGPVTWEFFVGQFRAKYYPDSFVEKMEQSLLTLTQGHRSVSEYEAEFNSLVRFVPAVANDDMEKAKRFRRGLVQEYRQILGASVLRDFSTVVEQARGMELVRNLPSQTQSASGTVPVGGSGSGQKRSFSGGGGSSQRPASKRFQGGRQSRPVQQWQSSSSAPRTSSSTPQLRPVPGQGMKCFRCGEGHRSSECSFRGTCRQCGREGHKASVCKQNPASIIKWEAVPVASSSSAPRGSVQTLAAPPVPQFSSGWVPPAVFTPAPPAGFYWNPAPSAPPSYASPAAVPAHPSQVLVRPLLRCPWESTPCLLLIPWAVLTW